MSKTLQNGSFQDAVGTVVNGGTIEFVLSHDAMIIAGGQVAPTRVSATLDSSGDMPGAFTILANDELTPSGTFYLTTVFDSNGARVFGPERWVFSGSSPIDLDAMTPTIVDPAFADPILSNPAANQAIAGAFSLSLLDGQFLPSDVTGLRVLSVGAFSGADLGAEINSADTALGASPGTIFVPSTRDGASLTTAMTITSGHNLVFDNGTWDFQAAVTFKMGSQLMGSCAPSNNVDAGTELEHNFNGDFLIWDGSGTASRSTGGGIRNILINNTYTGGDANGNLLVVKGTSAAQRAGAFAFENLTIAGLSSTNRQTRSIFIDGSGIGGSDVILDIHMSHVKVSGASTDNEDIRIDAVSNLFAHNVRVSNFQNGAQAAGVTVTGTATAPSSEIHFVACGISGSLTLDRVGNLSWFGGSFSTLTNTANTTLPITIFPGLLTNAPTNNAGAAQGVVRFTGGEFTFSRGLQLVSSEATQIQSENQLDLDSADATNGVRINRNGATNAPFTVKESGTNTDNFKVTGDSAGDAVLRGSFDPLEGKVSNVLRWIMKVVDHTDMTAGATADTFTLWTLPTNTMIHDVVATVVTAWAGTGPVSAAVASVGTTGGPNDLALDDNFFATGTRYDLHDATANGGKGALLFNATDKFAPHFYVAGGDIELQMDLTGGNHSATTAGQARIYILVSQPLGNTTTEAN